MHFVWHSVREFVAVVLILWSVASNSFAGEITHGPLLGDVTPTSATFWARASEPGAYKLLVDDKNGRVEKITTLSATATVERDLTLTWKILKLQPGRSYTYSIFQHPPNQRFSTILKDGDKLRFSTPREPADEKVVKLAFGSCSWDVSHPKQPVWTSISKAGIDAMCLIGDTPYIDSTKLEVQRKRYRDFYSIRELKEILPHTPTYGVWDDHDFGPDNALGLVPGKEGSRQAFLEYHANPSYGENNQGIYTSFRRGPVEVFLIDARWFANTEMSPMNPERKTLIGKQQWDWLRRGLKASTASIKILASGMIWNEAAAPDKLDYWMAYPYEREGVFQYIRKERINGVILISGDLHRSRHLIFPTKPRIGYDLQEFVSSPLAENSWEGNNVPSPYLKYDAALPDSFLRLTVNAEQQPVRVTAEFFSQDTVKHRVEISADDLRMGK